MASHSDNDRRWAISIDIEGFSILWETEDQILVALRQLMLGVFRIGTKCYPKEGERLFAHQTGDGFIIVSDFHEERMDRCLAIAIVLMRFVSTTGRYARCAIAEGGLADIKGCYSREVIDQMHDDRIYLGSGLMTIFPVMGSTLTRAVKTSKLGPKGPLLLMHCDLVRRTGGWARHTINPSAPDIAIIDWIGAASEMVTAIEKEIGLVALDRQKLLRELLAYADTPSLSKWKESIRQHLVPPGFDDSIHTSSE